jgi:hypothetical protein
LRNAGFDTAARSIVNALNTCFETVFREQTTPPVSGAGTIKLGPIGLRRKGLWMGTGNWQESRRKMGSINQMRGKIEGSLVL